MKKSIAPYSVNKRIAFFGLATLFTLFLHAPAKAQDYVDLASMGYYLSPNNNFRETTGSGDVQEWRFNLLLPKPFDNGDLLILALNAHQLKIIKQGMEIPEPDDNFHSYMFRLGYQKQINQDWSTTLMVIPQLNGASGDLIGTDLQMGGLIMFNWRNNGLKQYKFGLYANPHLFGPFLLPLVGLDWRLGERWQIFGTLPFTATASYKLGQKARTGFDFVANIVTYRYSNGDYLEKATNELSAFLDFYVFKNLVLRLQGGYSIAREYRRYRGDDKSALVVSAFDFGDRQMINQDLGDGLILRSSLIFRIPRPE
ncbi:MAG: DUF6268 family outer membrane beta-barrel protein [Candidatus Cyclobacteriaceae bacterium M3_2C_046]